MTKHTVVMAYGVYGKINEGRLEKLAKRYNGRYLGSGVLLGAKILNRDVSYTFEAKLDAALFKKRALTVRGVVKVKSYLMEA